jgi:hypothetical protein
LTDVSRKDHDATMPQGNEESLQQLIDRLPGLVEHFYNDAPAPHFSRAGTGKTAPFSPPAFTNWRDEQRSGAETAALLHQSHHMPELFLDGPDALRPPLPRPSATASARRWAPGERRRPDRLGRSAEPRLRRHAQRPQPQGRHHLLTRLFRETAPGGGGPCPPAEGPCGPATGEGSPERSSMPEALFAE